MNPNKSISRVLLELKNTEIIKNLGENDEDSYDNVYLCKKKGDPKRYVCKTIKESSFNPLEFSVAVIMRNNPHFIKVHNFIYNSSGDVLILMDYIPGGDLFDLVHNKKSYDLDEPTCCKIIFTLINALHELHNKKFIHNDVKLENILFHQKKRRAYLCDYGLARSIGTPSCYDGTTVYYSPEKIIKQPCDPSFDWWALGVVAYEILSSNYPFDINDNDNQEMMDINPSDMLTLYSQPLERIENVSQKAMDFVIRLLTLDKNKRLSSYDEIIKHPFLKF
ncbi:PK-1 [Choristoneura occidentalis granulovirus]|uniref:Serine/threonine-protein kinase n=2 Tax=Betabaculovirus chofumiferanae TaxID=3051997 RepID=Q918V7_GVCF|nr:PK-1 [Choristoneura fumiferana granulovirus]AAL05839.1 serine/threonine-protein kinase [Choristoneura fumiferana granulovirus]ABC61137.1 PK-1 [Choristoneura fumiferana granulovirus]